MTETTAASQVTRTQTSAVETLYEDDKALDVVGYVISLKRYLLPAVIVAAVVLAAGSVFAFTRPDTYVARSTIALVPGEVQSEAEATQQAAMLPMVARSYSQLANAPLVLDPAAKVLDPSGKLTGSKLGADVKVGWPSNSLIINLDVTGASSDEALARVKAITDSFVTEAPKSAGTDGGVALAAKAIYVQQGPLQPEPSTTPELLAVSVVGALALGFLTAVALDLTVGRRQRRAAAVQG
ncbi:hypothetical protein ACQB6R_00340 [Propionibacteriaceae bacterium G1746]|uniref:hypothetical protein n=1 Tax=Aestuariimicrobium sp. G57 TaxID=3418485 RepID=UPI003C266A25